MSCTGNCLSCGKCTNYEILNIFEEQSDIEPRSGFGIAVDIGTTSVVLALVNLINGEIVARHSFMNPQRVYGPDVISRIDAANKGKLVELRGLIVDAVSNGIGVLLEHGKDEGEKLVEIVIAGNTVMIHILLGASCEELGKFPFKPSLKLNESYSLFNSQVKIIPWLAVFVGGDVLAGLLSVLSRGDKMFLLIDLGTNGELALYIKGKLIVTATAAGSAFECSGHIGGASAVLDGLAEMVRTGVVDETGLMIPQTTPPFGHPSKEGNVFTQNEKQGDGSPALCTSKAGEPSPCFFLSQKGIRGLQLAKSAVRSGLEILLDSEGLKYADLDAVYLAGGIGQAMNVDSAITVGLLPSELKEKVMAIGNASLGGAVRLLLSPDKASVDMNKLLLDYTEINLAENYKFNGLFMKHLAFPQN